MSSALIDNILKLHEEMTPYVMKSGVGEKNWQRLVENVTKWKQPRLEFIFKFLHSLKNNEWQELENGRNQMCATPEMWDNMELFFDHEAFPEQVVVKKAMRAIKERWVAFKSEYRIFRDQEKIDRQSESSPS